MTPLAGFICAVIAGWYIRDGRRAAAAIIAPFLVVTAAQTWDIATGRGTSPPDTVTPFSGAISYYAVQVLILAVALCIAVEVGTLRARRAPARDGAGHRAVVISSVLAALWAAAATGVLLESSVVRQHSAGGSPPAYGVIGIGLSLVTVIVLGVLTFTGRRRGAAAAPADAVTATADQGRVSL